MFTRALFVLALIPSLSHAEMLIKHSSIELEVVGDFGGCGDLKESKNPNTGEELMTYVCGAPSDYKLFITSGSEGGSYLQLKKGVSRGDLLSDRALTINLNEGNFFRPFLKRPAGSKLNLASNFVAWHGQMTAEVFKPLALVYRVALIDPNGNALEEKLFVARLTGKHCIVKGGVIDVRKVRDANQAALGIANRANWLECATPATITRD